MGRWATHTLQLPNHKKLAIITAYRPCSAHLPSQGPLTILQQQYYAYRRKGYKTPNPRTLFLLDLQTHILYLQTQGHAILLGLDANLTTPDIPFDTFLAQCKLHDILKHKYPDPSATHTKGNRLDLIVGCSFILEHTASIGILNSSYGANSDHAVLYIDLHSSIFGQKHQQAPRPTRGLWIQNKKTTQQFRNLVQKSLSNNSTLLTLEHTLSQSTDTLEIEHLCNLIDDILTDTVLHAETLTRKRIFHTHPWSLQLKEAQHDVRTWKQYKKSLVRTNTIPVPIPSILTPSLNDALHYITSQLKASWKKLRTIKKHAFQHRTQFLQTRIQHFESLDDLHRAKIVRSILRHESKQALYQKLAIALKGLKTSGIPKIIRLTATGQAEEITSSTGLFAALLQRNQAHFHQAHNTPFALPPYRNYLPPLHSSHAFFDILNNDLSYFHDPPPELLALLKNMQQSSNTIKLEHSISETDFRNGIKKVSEGTSSSMSGRHYGIYKALLPVDSFTSRVVELLNLGVKHNFILRRWKKVLQVMLCKIPGNYDINKLRVIQLIEADLNMYFRLIWGKRLVHHAHSKQLIPKEQFGSVPGTLSTSALLLKVLSFDLIRITRSQATVFNNDATACYDRVLPTLSQICCQRLGLSHIAATFKLLFLREAEYHVKTQHGISDTFFTNALQEIYGVLQGSGAAPAIWLAVTIVLIAAYKELYPDPAIPNPLATFDIQKLIDAFVDDTDLWDILFHQLLTDTQCLRRMQARAQSWEKLLFLTGGQLNLSKCFWYYISWKWTDGLPSLSTIADTPGTISIRPGNSPTFQIIQRVETTAALKTLGLPTSPSGTTPAQFQHVAEKMQTLIQNLQKIHLTRTEADIVIPVYIHPKISYCLSSTFFTKTECDRLDRIFLPYLKSLTGFNRHTKRELFHASRRYGGAGIPTSWDLQGSQHLHLLIGHLQLRDLVGKYLLLNMDYLYMYLGFRAPVLTYPTTAFPSTISKHQYLPPSWLSTTWQYLTELQATVISATMSLPPQRLHDLPIMEQAVKHFSGINLLRINSVRLFLQVFYLSDITTSDGKLISPEYYQAHLPLQRSSTLHWPHQANPGMHSWRLWTTMLKTCYTHSNYHLRRPLSSWHDTPTRTQSWHTQIDPATSIVYQKQGSHWQTYIPSGRLRRHLSLHGTVAAPPHHSLPLTVIHQDGQLRPRTYCHREATIIFPSPPPLTFSQRLRQLPPHEKWIIGHTVTLTPPEESSLLSSIFNGSFVLASDGSCKGQASTYSSRLQSTTSLASFIASHSKSEPTSTFRVEAYGYLGTLYLLRAATTHLLLTYPTLPPHTIQQYMDNQGVLRRLRHTFHTSLKYHLLKHSDVIREIHSVERTLPFHIQRNHVKSHQADDIDDITELPIPLQVNKMCDTAASIAHDCSICTPPKQLPIFPTTNAYIRLSPLHHYTSKIDIHLRHATQDAALLTYIISKENWAPHVSDLVHWHSIEIALTRLSLPQQKNTIKLMFKLWATGRELRKRSVQHDHRCQRCSQLNEDWNHIFKCSHSTQRLQQSHIILRASFQKFQISPLMTQALFHGINSWISSTTTPFSWHAYTADPYLHTLQQAYADQTSIGWDNLLRGRLATKWLTSHDHYVNLRHQSHKYSSTRIAPSLVQALWNFSASLWKQRNEDIYGATLKDVQQKQRQLLLPKIQQAYHTQDRLPPMDRQMLFSTPLDQQLALPLSTLLQWYTFYQHCLHAPEVQTDTPPPFPPRLHTFFQQFTYPNRTQPLPPPAPNIAHNITAQTQQPANPSP